MYLLLSVCVNQRCECISESLFVSTNVVRDKDKKNVYIFHLVTHARVSALRAMLTRTPIRPSTHANPGVRFPDSVAFGNYPADDHNIDTCTKPSYMSGSSTLPYYIPFRALTHGEAPNLLVAGKTMATTFYANAASRLHPAEWSSGVAAGVCVCVFGGGGGVTPHTHAKRARNATPARMNINARTHISACVCTHTLSRLVPTQALRLC
jgi:hypothetical protein